MMLECCCRQASGVSVLSVADFIASTERGDRERAVTESLLCPWEKYVAVTGHNY